MALAMRNKKHMNENELPDGRKLNLPDEALLGAALAKTLIFVRNPTRRIGSNREFA
jgi:hypothetical protein